MKILITILLALFISNNANAQSLEDVCKYYEKSINGFYALIARAVKSRNEALDNGNVEGINDALHIIVNNEKFLKEEAQVYHYLDCSDFRE